MRNLYLLDIMIIDADDTEESNNYKKCFVIADNEDEAKELALNHSPYKHLNCKINGTPQNMNFMSECIIFPNDI